MNDIADDERQMRGERRDRKDFCFYPLFRAFTYRPHVTTPSAHSCSDRLMILRGFIDFRLSDRMVMCPAVDKEAVGGGVEADPEGCRIQNPK